MFKGYKEWLSYTQFSVITSFWCLRWDQTEILEDSFYILWKASRVDIICWLNLISSKLKFILLQEDIKIKSKHEWRREVSPSPLPLSLPGTRSNIHNALTIYQALSSYLTHQTSVLYPFHECYKLRIRVSITCLRLYRSIHGKARIWCWLRSLPFKPLCCIITHSFRFQNLFLYAICRRTSLIRWNLTILLSVTIFFLQ